VKVFSLARPRPGRGKHSAATSPPAKAAPFASDLQPSERRPPGQNAEETPASSAELSLPSPRVAQLVTAAIMLHGVLIVLSYLAIVQASEIQARVLEGFAPYLAAFHFAAEASTAEAGTAEGVSFFLARGEAWERTHRLQVKSSTERGEDGWIDVPLQGTAGTERRRRHQRFLTAIASLGQLEQNALAARLLLPVVASHPGAQMVRVIRLPNIMIPGGGDQDASPYTAAIVRDGEAIRLVRVPAPRLSSAAVGGRDQEQR
jgi:hypothetical protein